MMNIFYLHNDPHKAAMLHCDKHVVKMVLETAQILATVHHIHGNGHSVTYRRTHVNHPCVKWAAKSPENYRWLKELGLELAKEYQHRYLKIHKCENYIVKELSEPPPALKEVSEKWSEPPKCMPKEFQKESVIDSYQEYYIQSKKSFAKWTLREVPQFMLAY